jgi:hypothetical protein
MNKSTTATQSQMSGASVESPVEARERVAVAFGTSAAITVLFNTVLAWIKDAFEPLNAFMAALTGHHWWTHGLFDLAVFFALGWFLMSRGTETHLTNRLAVRLAAAVVIAGAGLAGWFVLV